MYEDITFIMDKTNVKCVNKMTEQIKENYLQNIFLNYHNNHNNDFLHEDFNFSTYQ